MTLRDLVDSFQKHWIVVVVTTIVATLAFGAVSHFSQTTYESSANLYFSLNSGPTGADINQGSTYTQNQMLSFAELATLPVVLDPVIRDLRLNTTDQKLADQITATRTQDTVLLVITVTSPSAQSAAGIANGVAKQLVTVTAKLSPRNANGKSTTSATVVKPAQVSTDPVSPNTRRNVLGGFIIGLLGGLLAAYLRDALDTRVRRAEDVDQALNVPVLASVSRNGVRGGRPLTVGASGAGIQAEEFRRLRANLQFLSVDTDRLCLLVSSAGAAEGKSTTCVNLAIALAEADMSVLVVDGDLRRPQVAEYLGLENAAGLTTVLIGRASVDDVVQHWGSQKLSVLAAGEIPPNPSELLATHALSDLIGAMEKRYDVVLIDSPPLLTVADASILSRLVTGVILVADVRSVRRAQLREAGAAVRAAGGQVLGVVLNRVKPQRSASHYYRGVAPQKVPAQDEVHEGRREGFAHAAQEGARTTGE